MKPLIVSSAVAILLLTFTQVFSQLPVKEWDVDFGGTLGDELSESVQTTDGGYLLAGESYSDVSGDKTQNNWGNFGTADYWVVKTDAAGTKQWDFRYGGSNEEYLTALQNTTDGGFIVGGFSDSKGGGNISQGKQGGFDYWILKADANGLKQWDARFGGSENDYLSDLIQTSDGGYLLGGYSYSGISGDKTQGSRGNWDYWIVKIDSNHNKQWDKRFGGSTYDELAALIQTADGGYLLGGYSDSEIDGDKTQSSRGRTDYWIVKIDADGAKVWDKRFGGSESDALSSLDQTYDGGYILGGSSNSPVSGDKSQTSQGESDYWIVKISATGAKQWDARYGGSEADELKDILQTTDGGYVLGGISHSEASGDKSQNSEGGYHDYWIVKIESNTIKLWDIVYGGSEVDWFTSLLQTSDQGYLFAGYSESPISGDKSEDTHGSYDYWIIKTTSGNPNLCEAPSALNDANVSPTTARLSWNPVAEAEKYKLRYKVSGTTNWTTISLSSTSKKITGLIPSTQYSWQVKSVCNSNPINLSDWSELKTFMTDPLRMQSNEVSTQFEVYPNPSNGNFTVEWSNGFVAEGISIEIENELGQKIFTYQENILSAKWKKEIDLSEASTGVYFIEVKSKR